MVNLIFRKGFQLVMKPVFRGVFPFRVPQLFRDGGQGVWLYFADTTTLFQDTAGNIPITAAGQSVCIALDKSQGLTLGPELVVNGDFSSGDSDWTLGAGWSVVDGVASFTATGSNSALVQSGAAPLSGFARVSFSVVRSAGTLSLRFGGGAPVTFSILSSGDYDLILPVAGVNDSISFSAGTTFTGTIDNISVKVFAGNHAIQRIATDRPIYTTDAAVENVSSDSLSWDAPAGTYTIAYRGNAGVVILDDQALSGATDIMQATKVYEYIAIDRALTPTERRQLKAYLEGRLP